jgi:hypothetical protein
MRYEIFRDGIWERFVIIKERHTFLYICTAEQQWIQVDLIFYSFSFNIKLGKAPNFLSKFCTLNTSKHKRNPLMPSLISVNRSVLTLWLAHYDTRFKRRWQHCCAITTACHITQQKLCHLCRKRARFCLLLRFFPNFISPSVSGRFVWNLCVLEWKSLGSCTDYDSKFFSIVLEERSVYILNVAELCSVELIQSPWRQRPHFPPKRQKKLIFII